MDHRRRTIRALALAALTAGMALVACSAGESDLARSAADAFGDRPPTATALQFVPAVEIEYPRQEAAVQAAGYHYRLKRTVPVYGSVLADGGVPVTGRIRFSGAGADGEPDPISNRLKEAESDAKGEYVIDVVPGHYVVDITPSNPRLPAQRQTLEISTATGRIDFTVLAGARYTGAILNAGGAPIAGATVRLLGSSGTPGSAVATTSADGRYAVAVGPDPQQQYRLEIAVPDQALPRVVFAGLSAAADAQMDIQYLPTTNTTVTGKVVVESGLAAAAGVEVVFSAKVGSNVQAAVRTDTGTPNDSGEALFRTTTDDAGRFSLSLPQGTWSYTLTVQPPLDREYGGLVVSDYVFGGQTTFSLPPKRTISGRVADLTGRAVELAEVLIKKTVTLKDSQQILRVYTDADGLFEAQIDSSVSAYDITVIPLRGALARCTRAAVGLEAFDETLIVHPGTVTDGYVEDRNGRPIPRVSVSLVSTDASSGAPPRTLAESLSPSDTQGRFVLVVPADPSITGCRGAAPLQ